MAGRIPIGRIAVVVALAVGAYVLVRGTGAPRFRALSPGVEFAMMRGGPFCQQGSSGIAVLRLDPARVRIRVHHFSREPDAKPFGILDWQRNTRALAVFNAGQYYPDWSYMGLLVGDGDVISSRAHAQFQAALVATPVKGAPAAHVLDLAKEPLDPHHPRWRDVAQSFMLFDAKGAIRVRKSVQVAARTAVAEDVNHRLLVITTEGGYTLHDFAQLLKAKPLHLTHAMSMDGGAEAELCVLAGAFHYGSFGHWDPNPGAPQPPGLVPLPAVVTVSAE